MKPMKPTVDPIRAQLACALGWKEAHVDFDQAVEAISVEHQGSHAPGFEHTPWQLLEHLRIAQKDLLEFCENPKYVHELEWPDGYWPQSPAPPDSAAWAASAAEFLADLEKLKQLVLNPDVNLSAAVPTGKETQTYLRSVLLVIDHNAYHLGQLVAVRKALGAWG
jgi:hypothetical protein